MPRTLAQNAQYIAETIKPAIKSAIEAQGVTVPSTDSFLDYADRIGEIEGGGSGYQLKDLPTGSIATVNDAADLPLNALKVSVEAWQEGTGDPSPSNVRPIHGWDSGEITVCDDIQSPTQTETITQQFPQTIYGAEWDVVDGSGNETDTIVDLSDLTWVKQSMNNANTGRIFQSQSILTIKILGQGLSNAFKFRDYNSLSGGAWEDLNLNEITIGVNYILICIQDNYADTTEVQAFLSQIGAELKTELATPTTIQLSPLSIRLLEGTNNIYADCGDVIEGEYFSGSAPNLSKVDYSIGSGSQPMLTDGRYLSGFASMSGYGAFPRDGSGNNLSVDWSKDFEIGMRFKFSAFPTYQALWGDGNNNSYRRGARIYYSNSDSGFWLCVSTDGSTLAIDTLLSLTPQLDKWYFIKLKFVKSTMALTVDVSDDFETFTSLYNNTLANVPYYDSSAYASIGGEARASAMTSDSLIIDTYNTYIKDSSGSIVWGAYKGA